MSKFPSTHTRFAIGDTVRKKSGSEWQGRIVGWYSTDLTPEGYAVESDTHAGSVQIYPAAALELVEEGAGMRYDIVWTHSYKGGYISGKYDRTLRKEEIQYQLPGECEWHPAKSYRAAQLQISRKKRKSTK